MKTENPEPQDHHNTFTLKPFFHLRDTKCSLERTFGLCGSTFSIFSNNAKRGFLYSSYYLSIYYLFRGSFNQYLVILQHRVASCFNKMLVSEVMSTARTGITKEDATYLLITLVFLHQQWSRYSILERREKMTMLNGPEREQERF